MVLLYGTVDSYTRGMSFRNIAPSNIRFPDELKEQIDRSCKENRRSMNSEVIFAVESHYADKEKYRSLKNFSTGDLLEELIRRLGAEGLTIQPAKEKEEPPDSA